MARTSNVDIVQLLESLQKAATQLGLMQKSDHLQYFPAVYGYPARVDLRSSGKSKPTDWLPSFENRDSMQVQYRMVKAVTDALVSVSKSEPLKKSKSKK